MMRSSFTKSLVALTALFSLNLYADGNHPNQAYRDVVSWSNGLTLNPNGNSFTHNATVDIDTSFYYKLHHGRGITNLGSTIVGTGLVKLIHNFDYGHANDERTVTYNDKPIAGFQVAEQAGYGIIDIRAITWEETSPSGIWDEHGWATGIVGNANWTHNALCKEGYRVSKMQGSHQSGYGLIDIRIYCSPMNSEDLDDNSDGNSGGNPGGIDIIITPPICNFNDLHCLKR